MFDNDGSLVLPEGVFKNVEIPKSEWKVKCPNCGHLIRMKARRNSTVCKKCHQEVLL